MTLFRQQYLTESARLEGWDYRSRGYYFVTICTKSRKPFFGEIVDGAMVASAAGQIVAEEWRAVHSGRRDVLLDEWVVMPNHVHGIVALTGGAVEVSRYPVETPRTKRDAILPSTEPYITVEDSDEPIQRGVSTTSVSGTAQRQPDYARFADACSGEQIQRGVSTMPRLAAGSLGAIIGQFKSRCTKRIWASGRRDFGWQPRFYDHIIRDDESLAETRQYIIDNPANWDAANVPDNLWM